MASPETDNNLKAALSIAEENETAETTDTAGAEAVNGAEQLFPDKVAEVAQALSGINQGMARDLVSQGIHPNDAHTLE